jgi:hypothetical protein
VTARNVVDPALFESGEECGVVLGGAQRWVDLEVGVEVADVAVVKNEVMGCDLTGDIDVPLFGAPDGFETLLGGDVLDVKWHSSILGEADVPGDADVLADGGDALETEGVADAALVHGAFSAELFGFTMGGQH